MYLPLYGLCLGRLLLSPLILFFISIATSTMTTTGPAAVTYLYGKPSHTLRRKINNNYNYIIDFVTTRYVYRNTHNPSHTTKTAAASTPLRNYYYYYYQRFIWLNWKNQIQIKYYRRYTLLYSSSSLMDESEPFHNGDCCNNDSWKTADDCETISYNNNILSSLLFFRAFHYPQWTAQLGLFVSLAHGWEALQFSGARTW